MSRVSSGENLLTKAASTGAGFNKGAVLFVTVFSPFLTTTMASSVNVALPSIGKELAVDAVLLSWVTTAYLLASAMFLVPFGRVVCIVGVFASLVRGRAR